MKNIVLNKCFKAIISVKEMEASRLFLWCSMLMWLVFGVWAYVAPLAIFSVAQGEVVPASQIKEIQHFEGGIIREILVSEGDLVQQGQALIELETIASSADVEQLRVSIAALQVDQVRLSVEVQDKTTGLIFSDELIDTFPTLVEQAKNTYQARRRHLENEMATLRETVVQREEEIRQIDVRIASQKESLILTNEQVEISEDLMKHDLTNRYTHLELLRAQTNMQSKIDEDMAAKRRAQSSLNEARSTLLTARSKYVESVRTQLENVKRQLQSHSEQLKKFEDNLKRTILRAPVDGTVKGMRVSTVGGVIQPGSTVLDIVPKGDELVIEAKLAINDIGYVRAGQDVKISLDSHDAMRFGDIDGVVEYVSPDTFVSEQEGAFYKVNITTDKPSFLKDGHAYDLYPGVKVVAKIHTGTRTVFEYIFDPFLGSMSSAMSER